MWASGTIPGSLVDGAWHFPTIVTTTATGKETEWTAIVEQILDREGGDTVVIPITEKALEIGSRATAMPAGVIAQLRIEGKHVASENMRKVVPTRISEGKNIGRANETNVLAQAIRNGLGMYVKQNRKAVQTTKASDKRPPPMLVQRLDSSTGATLRDIDFKCGRIMLQKKLNGVRLVSYWDADEGRVVMYSRTGLEYSGQNTIRAVLKNVLKNSNGLYLDGELYKRGLSLQEISGKARRHVDGSIEIENTDLEYHVFDSFRVAQKTEGTNTPFSERYDEAVAAVADVDSDYVDIVDAEVIHSREDMMRFVDIFIEQGYEGGIARKSWEGYEYSLNGKHSNNLVKIKPIFSEEYTCIDFTRGKRGKDADAIIWICETVDKKRFKVVPKNMTYDVRRELYAKFVADPNDFDQNYKGKPLTIEFAELSDSGTPSQAKAVAFRTYE
jgi:ATP-dependent DNA ligase